MKNKTIKKIFLYAFILLSLIVVFHSILFIINQQINIKYYFDDCLPNSSADLTYICQKDFFLELILYAKILIFYAIYGMVLLYYYSRKDHKIKKVDFYGNEIWPNGQKNKNKK